MPLEIRTRVELFDKHRLVTGIEGWVHGVFFNMPNKSNTDLVVLALIAEKPLHGYDLVKRSAEDRVTDWAELPASSVYNSLKNLERLGYISSKEVRVGKSPPRAVYKITGSGRNALIASLLRLLTEPVQFHDNFNIALLGIDKIPQDKVIDAIDLNSEQADRKLAELEEFLKSNETSMSPAKRAIYSRLLALFQAHLEWVKEFRRFFERP